MSVTAQTMITTAVRRLTGTSGYTLTTNEQTDFLPVLNAMMEGWSLERLMIYTILLENFPLVAGTGSYTIGSSGAFNTTRPEKLTNPCYIRNTDGKTDFPPLKLIEPEMYGRISSKGTNATGLPEYIYCDYAYPLATLYLWPVPNQAYTLYLSSFKQLQQFSAISTAISLPPGYQRAIEWNLCLELADEIGIQPSALMIENARKSKAAVKKINAPDVVMRIDPTLVKQNTRANIYIGP